MLERNFLAENGTEVDLIVLDNKERELVFVEVKTRGSDDFGSPIQAAMSRGKQSNWRGAAGYFRYLNWREYGNWDYRFDVVAVIIDEKSPSENKIEHFENVSWLH